MKIINPSNGTFTLPIEIMSIRRSQQDALFKMLNLNEDVKQDTTTAVVWKVLVYDKLGQDVISPSLRLGELRGAGVTLHLQPIPDVPAIYFVQPTAENINIIADDLKKGMYDSVHLNFSSTLSRGLLEELAAQTVLSNTASMVAQVYDQYLNYICLETNLFSLEQPGTYSLLHNPTTPESIIEQIVDQIATALFSVIVTNGAIPIIKCPRGNVAEAVAKKLESRLRDNLINSRTNLFAEKIHLPRPVLILLDRDLDLASMLTHSWTYSTLFHDLLEMKLNRITLTAEEKGRSVVKNYDIDVTEDFWAKNASCPLPEVGNKETKLYKEAVNNVGKETTDQSLTSTIAALPELRRRQKVLDMHTVIATHLLNSIVKRQLDSFISMEEAINKLNIPALVEVIKDPKKEPSDKLRLFLIYFLSTGTLSKEHLNAIEMSLQEAGCNVESLNYIKKVHMVSKMTQIPAPAATSLSTNDLLGSFSSNFSKLTEGLQSVGIGEGFGSIIAGVKNMLPTRKELPITLIVDSIMDSHTQSSLTDDYLTLDPKLSRSSQTPLKKASFSDAVVFVVGGGNYQEYHNLVDYSQRSGMIKKNIIYGSTALLSADSFIEELNFLGK